MCDTNKRGNKDARKSVHVNVKYWGFFAAKLAVVGAILLTLLRILVHMAPQPPTFMGRVKPRYPIGYDLGFTFLMLLFWLFAAGVFWLVVWDQRYRCRTCLRRLRMPVHRGSWKHVLLDAPNTQYICVFGHGTLKVDDLALTGNHPPDWEQHEDIWKELYSLEETKH